MADAAVSSARPSRALEIINRGRALTMEMVRLDRERGIPAELLIRPYEPAA